MRGGHLAALAALSLLVAVVAVLALSGGGGGSRLTVSAAASLQRPFERYARHLEGGAPRFSFAGSDALAAQIEQGVRPDVFASANTRLPEMLHAKGLVDWPVVFAANRLVLAVPAGSRRIGGLADVGRPGVALAIGTPTVPVGAYTRTLIGRLGTAERRAVLANVRDVEPDVSGIVGKLSEGAVDAGFLYATDVAASGGRLRAIELPARLQPRVAYGAAIVRGTGHLAHAHAFLAGLLSGAGRRALLESGFSAP